MFTVIPTEHFDKWHRGLKDKRAAAKIAMRIVRLQMGNFGDAKSVGGKVSELRLTEGPGYRVYFTQRGEEIIILLCGGDKGSQSRDIRTAHEMAEELHGER